MPRKAKGPYLYQRQDTGLYIIRQSGKSERSTGTRNAEQAEAILNAHKAEALRPATNVDPNDLYVADVLATYAEKKAPKAEDTDRIHYALKPLLSFWGARKVSEISEDSCDDYAASRFKRAKKDLETGEELPPEPIADGTIIRELSTLRAALNYCQEIRYLSNAPRVYTPPKPDAKDRWLTRDEAARLLDAARSSPRTRHLAKFIMIGLYTGTRKSAILRLQYRQNYEGGWVDLTHGVLYRKPVGKAQTKKKQPPVAVPPFLLKNLKCWRRKSQQNVIEFKRQPVSSIKSGWKTIVDIADVGSDVTPHTLRHTAITWAMQTGAASTWELGGYFGVSQDTLLQVYAHHHPAHLQNAVLAAAAGGRKL